VNAQGERERKREKFRSYLSILDLSHIYYSCGSILFDSYDLFKFSSVDFSSHFPPSRRGSDLDSAPFPCLVKSLSPTRLSRIHSVDSQDLEQSFVLPQSSRASLCRENPLSIVQLPFSLLSSTVWSKKGDIILKVGLIITCERVYYNCSSSKRVGQHRFKGGEFPN